MAQIVPRKGKKGTSYLCRIRIKRDGEIVHQESRTFARRALAADWGRRREISLQTNAGLAAAIAGPCAVGDLIQEYLEKFPTAGATKSHALKKLQTYPLAKCDARQLSAASLIDHVHWRLQTVQPQSIRDLMWLRIVLRTMSATRNLGLSLGCIDDAEAILKAHNQISTGAQRNRLPTNAELRRLTEYFADRPRSKLPMVDLMWSAIYSARRISELCRMRRLDTDFDHRSMLIRAVKHPHKKATNDLVAELPENAIRLLSARPDGDLFFDRINSQSVGTTWARACSVLGIEDLHWHDLRHEATTRLFESGRTIPQVAAVTLHQKWDTLRVYAHLQPRPASIDLWDILPNWPNRT